MAVEISFGQAEANIFKLLRKEDLHESERCVGMQRLNSCTTDNTVALRLNNARLRLPDKDRSNMDANNWNDFHECKVFGPF